MIQCFFYEQQKRQTIRAEEIFEIMMVENVPKLMTDTNQRDPGSSETTKQDKYHVIN